MSTSTPSSSSTPTTTTPTITTSGTETAGQELQTLADAVAKVLLAGTIGTVKTIPNALASGELDTTILTEPLQIQAYAESIASQMNAQSSPTFEDLTDRIADITINTTAQGAGTLEVQVIDPTWVLLTSGFINADENGYLFPPILINFPSGTDCYWELCQVSASTDLHQPQLLLTFEDKIVSTLRTIGPATKGAIAQGNPNQTLGGFIKQLIDNANKVLKPNPEIRLVEMISPQDPNYTVPITSIPTSASSPLRPNPNKTKSGLSPAQQAQIDAAQAMAQAQIMGDFGNHSLTAPATGAKPASTSMSQAEQNYAAAWNAYVQSILAHPNLSGGGTEYP